MKRYGTVCGKLLEPYEYRKFVRCFDCRAYGAARQRKSLDKIAAACGKRKNAPKKVRVQTGKRSNARPVTRMLIVLISIIV